MMMLVIFDVRLRYVEKEPGKFVGDTGCEKLPVEVFVLLIVIMAVIMVHLCLLVLMMMMATIVWRWLQICGAGCTFEEGAEECHDKVKNNKAHLTCLPVFQRFFSALYCNSVGLIGAILGNRLPSRRSWRDLRPEPSEDLQVKKQGEIIEDLFSENSGNNRKPVFKNRGK